MALEPSTSGLKRKSDHNSDILSNISSSFKNEIIKDLLKSQFTKTKTNIKEETTSLMTELMKVIVVETVLRAANIATDELKTTVGVEHVEAILPQLMLDYP